jgi:uncharacterized protein
MNDGKNTQRINEMYAAFGRGDIGFILDQLTEDVRWVVYVESIVPWAGDFSGKKEVPRFFEAHSSVDVLGFEPKEAVAEGDTVVSMGEFACRVRSTGKTSRSKWVFIWKFRGGKVSSHEQFHDASLAEAFR